VEVRTNLVTPARVMGLLLAKTHVAKEDKRVPNCRGNLLDCSM